jgi:hypothetical protein
MKKKPLMTAEERTRAIIDGWRGLPEEFGMLKGLLCAGIAIAAAARTMTKDRHVIDAEETIIDQHLNRYMIAERMDELRAGARMADVERAKAALDKVGG